MKESQPQPLITDNANRNSPTNTLNVSDNANSRKLHLPLTKFHNEVVITKTLAANRKSSATAANV